MTPRKSRPRVLLAKHLAGWGNINMQPFDETPWMSPPCPSSHGDQVWPDSDRVQSTPNRDSNVSFCLFTPRAPPSAHAWPSRSRCGALLMIHLVGNCKAKVSLVGRETLQVLIPSRGSLLRAGLVIALEGIETNSVVLVVFVTSKDGEYNIVTPSAHVIRGMLRSRKSSGVRDRERPSSTINVQGCFEFACGDHGLFIQRVNGLTLSEHSAMGLEIRDVSRPAI